MEDTEGRSRSWCKGVNEGEEGALQIAEGSWISRLGILESQGAPAPWKKERKFNRSTAFVYGDWSIFEFFETF